MEPLFEALTLALTRSAGPDFVVERCQDPDDVLFLARQWKRRGYDIVRLDLHGHGAGGEFQLGDELLFSSDGTGYGRARRLGPQLARGAEVRLLGCRTGSEPLMAKADGTRRSGARLLRDLEGLLRGARRVWGTTDFIGVRHVGSRGLTPAGERLLCRFDGTRPTIPPVGRGDP
jgi:hypothetical protein